MLTFDSLREVNATTDVVIETETEAVIAEDLAHQAIEAQDPLVVMVKLIRIQPAETTGNVSAKTGTLAETEEVEERGIGRGTGGQLDVMRDETMMTGHREGIETCSMIDV